MRLLILGGTAFLGHTIVRLALARGFDVTCLARGTSPVAEGAKLVVADRDEDDAFVAVRDQQWDAIIDVTRQPGHASRAVRDLRGSHWVYISSASVYASFDAREQTESAPILSPLASDMMTDPSQYGQAKVACENAYRSATSGNSQATLTIIRAGLIGGAGDWSSRSGYYPWRFAHPTGADVLVPDDPTFPVAMIDVEDLASWVLDCAERRIQGTFNATGPTLTLDPSASVGCRKVGLWK